MLINRNIVALFALPFMASATASELSIGAVRLIMNRLIAVIMKIQRQFPWLVMKVILLCSSDHVRFYSVAKWKNELSLTASWMPLEFDPADNDDYAMQQLDKRDSTAMAGLPGITTSVGELWKPLRLRTFWITATAGWGAIDFPQNADRSPVADTCAGRALLWREFQWLLLWHFREWVPS